MQDGGNVKVHEPTTVSVNPQALVLLTHAY